MGGRVGEAGVFRWGGWVVGGCVWVRLGGLVCVMVWFAVLYGWGGGGHKRVGWVGVCVGR